MFENDGKDLTVNYTGSGLNIYSKPMKSWGKSTKERFDLGVKTFKGQESQNTSSIFTGYKNIHLNGNYFNYDEFKTAIDKSLAETKNYKIVLKRTGKVIEKNDFDKVLEDFSKMSNYIKISNRENARCSTHKNYEIIDSKSQNESVITKGMFMMSKKTELTAGNYVNGEEMLRALSKFKVVENKPEAAKTKKKKNSLIPRLNPDDSAIDYDYDETYKPKRQKVINIQKKKVKVAPIIASILVAAALLTPTKKVTAQTYETANNSVSYSVDKLEQVNTYETESEAYTRYLNNISLGNRINIDSDINYYESSDYQSGGADSYGLIGNQTIGGNDFSVNMVSILNGGEIVYVNSNLGDNVGQNVQEYITANNLSINQIDIMIHLSTPTAGWVNTKDVFKNEDGVKLIETKTNVTEKVEDTVNNYTIGENIEIDIDGKMVSFNPYNESGILYKSGDLITGSDGNTYSVNNLEVNSKSVVQSFDVSETTMGLIKSTEVSAALSALSLALGVSLTKKKKYSYKFKLLQGENSESNFSKREISTKTYQEILASCNESFKKESKFQRLINKIPSVKETWAAVSKWRFNKKNFAIEQISISKPMLRRVGYERELEQNARR